MLEFVNRYVEEPDVVAEDKVVLEDIVDGTFVLVG